MNKVLALVHTWLVIDFFGDSRRAGNAHGSSLTTTIFAQSFFGFLFAVLLYPETPAVPFVAANLCLSTLLMAVGALGDESRPERRAADDHLLHGTPIGKLAIALARSGHAAFSLLLVTVGMALPPALLLAMLTDQWAMAPAYVAGACLCSGLAGGALGIIARACTRWFGAARTALLTGTLRALLLGGGLVLMAVALPRLRGNADALPIGRLGAELLPPYQVARWLAAPAHEVWRLFALLAAGGILLVLGMMLAGQDEPRSHVVRNRSLLRSLLVRLTRAGPHRAIAEFVAISMWRSSGFRARVLPLLGIPAATALLSLRGPAGEHDFELRCVMLQLPAIYLPFLVAFLPRSDQPGTGWVFALAPGLTSEQVQDATWRALVTHVLLPVQALTLALMVTAPAQALATLPAALFALGLAVVSARAAVRGLEVVPFTRPRDVETGPDLGVTFANALLLGGLGLAFGHWLAPAWRWLAALLAVGLAIATLAREHGAGSPLANPDDRAGAEPAESTEPIGQAKDPSSGFVAAPASLGRELRAIVVLYGCLCALPLLAGTIFAA